MGFEHIFSNFKNKKILVIGDIVLDRYIWGRVNRISPEAPVPIVEVTDEDFLLGGSANVAHNIVSLGGNATVLGIVGRDRAGDALKRLLGEKGIDSCMFDDQRPTIVKTRVKAHNQQIVRFDREDKKKVSGKTFDALIGSVRRAVRDHDAIIISDYKKGVVSSELVAEVVKAARPKKKFIAVDPKTGHFHCYKNVSLITPNLMEASHGSGIEIKDEKSLVKAGRILLRKLPCKAVLITRGEEGMSLFDKNTVTHIPTVARHVYDVTGAGDTVIATFTLAYASGASLKDAAIISNHAAGIVVGEVGTAVTTPAKISRSITSSKKFSKHSAKL